MSILKRTFASSHIDQDSVRILQCTFDHSGVSTYLRIEVNITNKICSALCFNNWKYFFKVGLKRYWLGPKAWRPWCLEATTATRDAGAQSCTAVPTTWHFPRSKSDSRFSPLAFVQSRTSCKAAAPAGVTLLWTLFFILMGIWHTLLKKLLYSDVSHVNPTFSMKQMKGRKEVRQFSGHLYSQFLLSIMERKRHGLQDQFREGIWHERDSMKTSANICYGKNRQNKIIRPPTLVKLNESGWDMQHGHCI